MSNSDNKIALSNLLTKIKAADGGCMPTASPIPRRKDSQRIYNAISSGGTVVSFGYNNEAISEYMRSDRVKVKKPTFVKTSLLKSMLDKS